MTQVSRTSMTGADIASSLRQVFSTLQELEKAETAGIELAPTAAEEVVATKFSPEDSIQKDKVICLECGAEMRQLTQKHLVFHGMSLKEYRNKYGFAMRTPLAAKSLTKAGSKAAKKRGLPENLKKAIEARRQSKAKVAAKSSVSAAETGKKVKRRTSRKKTA